MHTNNAMLRKFSWATNALWPADLARKKIPATVLLSELDEVVPTRAIDQLFRDFNTKKIEGGTLSIQGVTFDCQVFENATHGEMVLNPEHRKKTVQIIAQMMKICYIPEDPIATSQGPHNWFLDGKRNDDLFKTFGNIWTAAVPGNFLVNN